MDKDLDKAKKVIELYRAYQRLLANTDFQKVVIKGYLENYPLELLYGTPYASNRNDQQLFAVGFFKQYLDELETNADSASRYIKEYEEANQ